MLKDLKYLDYQLIDDDMRKTAFQKYGEAMNELENANLADKKEDDDKDIDPEMIAAHIACTVRMLDKIHTADKNG